MTENFILNVGANFLLGSVSVLFWAGVARWLGGMFTTNPRARVGAFSLPLGYSIGKYSFVAAPTSNAWLPAASALGAMVALVGLWFYLFGGKDEASALGRD